MAWPTYRLIEYRKKCDQGHGGRHVKSLFLELN
jgi:hypothetical protein